MATVAVVTEADLENRVYADMPVMIWLVGWLRVRRWPLSPTGEMVCQSMKKRGRQMPLPRRLCRKCSRWLTCAGVNMDFG